MTNSINTDSQFPLPRPTTVHLANLCSEFYSTFSEEEILGIIDGLQVRREIPLKYSYKGKGAKIWNSFYLKYITTRWYRTSLEVELLKDNFDYINHVLQNYKQFDVMDVGAGNSYPVKKFISRLNHLNRINKYVALDISKELLEASRSNFKKWFPLLAFYSCQIDIENSSIPKIFTQFGSDDNIPKIFLHLGVTIGNHPHRIAVFKNFRDSMEKDDLLVFTNEIGSNSQWDGRVRGGCQYHAEQVYQWLKNNIGIKSEDCQLVRKYDLETDSVVANIKFCCQYIISFMVRGTEHKIEISEGEEITIWRHHKYEMPELLQELGQAGLELIHYSTNNYSSHIMAICRTVSN